MHNSTEIKSNFEPKILVYFCDSCGGAHSSRSQIALDNISDAITAMHFKCAREVTPQQIYNGFTNGADGILICGCLVRDCTETANDLEVLRSLYRNQMTLKKMGLVPDRLREEWVVQGTTDHLEKIIADFSVQLKELGPICLLSSGQTDGPKLKIRESQA